MPNSTQNQTKPQMVDSFSLSLIMTSTRMADAVSNYLCKRLQQTGLVVTPSQLQFLSKLECGDNHASELSRMLGVSRQRVAKSVSELVELGYLRQVPGAGKQKIIQFTKQGEQLIANARLSIAEFDSRLVEQLGIESLKDLQAALEKIIGQTEDLEN